MSAFDYPPPATDYKGDPACAECAYVSLDEATYYHPADSAAVAHPMDVSRYAEATPFCSRSCFLYWQWRQEQKAVAS